MSELAPVASTSVASTPVAPTSVAPSAAAPSAPNRRQRLRLRDLCDEVLASFRVAHDREVIGEEERQDARAVLADLSPRRS